MLIASSAPCAAHSAAASVAMAAEVSGLSCILDTTPIHSWFHVQSAAFDSSRASAATSRPDSSSSALFAAIVGVFVVVPLCALGYFVRRASGPVLALASITKAAFRPLES